MIKLIGLDVDGTLTKGEVIYDSQGQSIKIFNVKDGLAIANSIKEGYIVAIITGRKCESIEKRGRELGVTDIYQGISNKVEILNELCKKYSISKDEIAYMGDDLNDLGAIKKSAFSGAPKDAVEEILKSVDFVSSKNGGEGAAREFIEAIMKKENKWDAVVDKYRNQGGLN